MDQDLIIFLSSTFLLFFISCVTARKLLRNNYKLRSIWIICFLVIGAGVGLTISILAKGTFLETAVIVAFFAIISIISAITLFTSRNMFQAFIRDDKNKNDGTSKK